MPTNLSQSDRALPAREQVLEEVKQLVAEQVSLPIVDIREEQELIADLGYDSLDIVELAMEIEEHFCISVPDSLSTEARTVGQVASGVMELLAVQTD